MAKIKDVRELLKLVTTTSEYHGAWYNEDHWTQILVHTLGFDVKDYYFNGSIVRKALTVVNRIAPQSCIVLWPSIHHANTFACKDRDLFAPNHH
jgi:hypothetical protein